MSVYEMLLSSQDRTMEVTVMRDGVEQTLSVEASTEDYVYKPEGGRILSYSGRQYWLAQPQQYF